MSLGYCQQGHVYSKRVHGEICPYCNTYVRETVRKAENPQMEYIDGDILAADDLEFVTGWIVCISGPHKGKDFRIVANKNFIGRAPDMDIRLVKDPEIEERNHAVITYDYERNETIIEAGGAASRGVVRVLDESGDWKLVNTELLTIGKRIKMGKQGEESEFIFVPLCGEGEGIPITHRWE